MPHQQLRMSVPAAAAVPSSRMLPGRNASAARVWRRGFIVVLGAAAALTASVANAAPQPLDAPLVDASDADVVYRLVERWLADGRVDPRVLPASTPATA